VVDRELELGMSWGEIEIKDALSSIRAVCEVQPITLRPMTARLRSLCVYRVSLYAASIEHRFVLKTVRL